MRKSKGKALVVGLVVNWKKPLAQQLVVRLVRWLKGNGHRLVFADPLPRGLGISGDGTRAEFRKADLVLALGGDGTLLRAVRLVGALEKPIMGVNLGGLGFLTEFSSQEAQAGITAFVRGVHCEERRMVLVCRLGDHSGERRVGYAFNDCALNMGPEGRVVEVKVHWERYFVNKFVGDGLVVATPTGSTAYSLAAGGPVVYPTMNAIVLTPLCPHALAARPIVLPTEGTVTLELTGKSQGAVLSLDGQERWRVCPGMRVFISQADFSVRLVVPKGKSYFEILRDKLKWSGSQR